MTRLNENVALNTKNRSYQVTAQISVPADGADGAIVVQGGRTGGWGLVATGGKLAYHYNFCGLFSTTVTSALRSRPELTRSEPSSPTTAGASVAVVT
jgi:arylsulfatase